MGYSRRCFVRLSLGSSLVDYRKNLYLDSCDREMKMLRPANNCSFVRAPVLWLTLVVTMLLVPDWVRGQRCLAQVRLDSMLAVDPDVRAIYEEGREQVVTYLSQSRLPVREIAVIPVVFHIVYAEDDQNISREQVLSQIAVLNSDFRGLAANVGVVSAHFKSLIADAGIEFCLADTDPDGAPTEGIVRRQTDVPQIGLKYSFDNRRRIYHTELGGDDIWDPAHYLNVYVCEMGNNVFGEASFPNLGPADEDGVVMDYRSFGTIGSARAPTDKGKTLVHEIGHYLGLKHIWGNSQGCDSDDGIADTPDQEKPTSGCPSESRVSCGSFDLFYDYMDYSDDACLAVFTPQQVEYMRAVLTMLRPDLANGSSVCADTKKGIDFVDFIQLQGNPSYGQVYLEAQDSPIFKATVDILDVPGHHLMPAWQVFFPGKYPLPVETLAPGMYFVRLTAGNKQRIFKLIVTR